MKKRVKLALSGLIYGKLSNMKTLYNAEAICNITLREESPFDLATWTNKRSRPGGLFRLKLKEYEVSDYAWCYQFQDLDGVMNYKVIGNDEDLKSQFNGVKICRKSGREPEIRYKASVIIEFIGGETRIKYFDSNYEAKEEFERVSALIPKPFEFD